MTLFVRFRAASPRSSRSSSGAVCNRAGQALSTTTLRRPRSTGGVAGSGRPRVMSGTHGDVADAVLRRVGHDPQQLDVVLQRRVLEIGRICRFETSTPRLGRSIAMPGFVVTAYVLRDRAAPADVNRARDNPLKDGIEESYR